ncbi:MAG: formate dehydrogenase accessory protein FdhE [Anaerolineae bacterium]|jgi:FdhE protein
MFSDSAYNHTAIRIPVDARVLAAELGRRVAQRPELAGMVAPYLALLSAQAPVEVAFSPSPLPEAEVRTRLGRGIPALAPEDFRPDLQVLRPLWEEVCAIAARSFPDLAAGLDSIRMWSDGRGDALLSAATYYLRGEESLLAQEAGLDESLFSFVLNNTLHPFLRRIASVLAPLVDPESWYRPYCPICGGEPDFAALTKPHGARRLLCSRCDFEWPYRRSSCPFCGNDNPDQYLYVPSEDNIYRLYLCDRCRRYLKVIDLRELMEEPPLPVERILTLPMDRAARAEGFGVRSTNLAQEVPTGELQFRKDGIVSPWDDA